MKYIKIILFFIFFISGNAIGANNNQTTPAASNAGAQVTSNRGGGVA